MIEKKIIFSAVKLIFLPSIEPSRELISKIPCSASNVQYFKWQKWFTLRVPSAVLNVVHNTSNDDGRPRPIAAVVVIEPDDGHVMSRVVAPTEIDGARYPTPKNPPLLALERCSIFHKTRESTCIEYSSTNYVNFRSPLYEISFLSSRWSP